MKRWIVMLSLYWLAMVSVAAAIDIHAHHGHGQSTLLMTPGVALGSLVVFLIFGLLRWKFGRYARWPFMVLPVWLLPIFGAVLGMFATVIPNYKTADFPMESDYFFVVFVAVPLWIIGAGLGVFASTFILWIPGLFILNRRLKRRRAAMVLGYLEQAVRLNLPLPPMLDAARKSETGTLSLRLMSLKNALEDGSTMHDALKVAVPEISRRQRATIGAGERIGRLPQILARLVAEQHTQVNTKFFLNPIGWFYILYVFMITSLLMTGAMIFIVPKFQAISNDFGVRLNPVTQALIFFSRWFTGHAYRGQSPPGAFSILISVLGIASVFAFLSLLHNRGWLPLVHRVPLLGGWLTDRGWADATLVIGQSLRGGQPLYDALHEAAEMRTTPVVTRALRRWGTLMESGQEIHAAALTAGVPRLIASMLATAHMCTHPAEIFEFLSRYYTLRQGRIANLLYQLVQPAMTLLLGALVCWFAYAMFSPLVQWIEAVMPIGTEIR